MSNLGQKLVALLLCMPAIIGVIWWQSSVIWYGWADMLSGKIFVYCPENGWAVTLFIETMICIAILTIVGLANLIDCPTTWKDDIEDLVKKQLSKTVDKD